jgi:thiol:disulfide interchange protein DsbD
MKRLLLRAVAVIAGSLAVGAWAGPLEEGNGVSNVVTTPQVTSQLVAERQSITPGGVLAIALDQAIIDHWHTYWVNPGETGLPTRIKWSLPPGWTATSIRWPTPERLMVGPIVNYGYEGRVRLLSDLHAASDAKPGDKVNIAADVTWLVCQQMCIPQRARLTLNLPVSSATGEPVAGAGLIFAQANTALPHASTLEVKLVQNASTTELTWPARDTVRGAVFFPESSTVLAANVGQKLLEDDGGYHLIFEKRAELGEGSLRGILSIDGQGVPLDVRPASTDGGSASPQRAAMLGGAAHRQGATTTASISTIGIWQAVLLAMLGGAILNLMPCVFPVLSMKAFALARHGRSRARAHGLAYAVGVILCFISIAAILLALRNAGSQIGWGFQLQSPLVVILLSYVMLSLGLSMSGVFMVGTSTMGVGSELAGREGFSGSFFTGVLATVVAAPCTAPFMGAAVGYALLQSWWVGLCVFAALGIGMALPFVLLTCFDSLLERMPAPGLWMERLKQLLAFPLYATAAWLLWVLTIQAGPTGLALGFAGCLLIAIAAYLYGQHFSGRWDWIGKGVAAAAVLAAILIPVLSRPERAAVTSRSDVAAREVPFSEQKIATELNAGRPVFVDFTAAWCITCLANERTALARGAVRNAMARKEVTYMTADWTNQDPRITTMLQKFGRFGVPLYLLYSPSRPNEPTILPQLLTENIVLRQLDTLP